MLVCRGHVARGASSKPELRIRTAAIVATPLAVERRQVLARWLVVRRGLAAAVRQGLAAVVRRGLAAAVRREPRARALARWRVDPLAQGVDRPAQVSEERPADRVE